MGEKSTWITDDVEGTRFYLEGIGNPNTTPQQKLQMIRKFKNSIAKRQAYWQNGYKENNADVKKYEKVYLTDINTKIRNLRMKEYLVCIN